MSVVAVVAMVQNTQLSR